MLSSEERLLSTPFRWRVLLGYPLLAILGAGTARGAIVTLIPSAAMQVRECQAHVIDTRGGEIIAPCGQQIHTSANATVGWIETADRIAPFLTDVSQDGEFPLDRLVPSGTVVFPIDRQLGTNERLRLVSLVPPRDNTSLRPLFMRDITSLDAKPKMPEGKAIAILLDGQGRAIAASRPTAIRAGADTLVWPETRGETKLVTQLSFSPATKQTDPSEVGIRVANDDGGRLPDERVDAAGSLFAIWYDLPAGDLRLLIDSSKWRLAKDTVALARGSVTLVEESLRKLPALTVSIGAYSAELTEELTLTIAEAIDENKPIRTLPVAPGQSYTIESLPAAPLAVDLHIGDYLMAKRVDLASGDDGQLTMALNPLRVSGTVFHGDTPARATLRFMQKTTPLMVETDDRGSYTAILWQPQRYVIETVLADHPDMPPLSEMVLIRTSQTLDINIPANALRVRVFDATDGKALERGDIVIHNRWSDRSGSRSAVVSVAIDGQVTDLPPQRIGTTEIRVRAAGYSDAGPVQVLVDQGLRNRVIEIPMTRNTKTASLLILLDGVSPAAGAEIGAFSNDRMTWHGTADGEGRIVIPEGATKGRVVVRHPSAASEVVLFGNLSGLERFSLKQAAPPLTVKIVGRDGTRIGPAAAQVSLSLAGGVRLTGTEAAFATWSIAATAPDGTFTARGLRPGPFRIFVTRGASLAQIQAGTFDTLATTIPYPWPADATARLVAE